MLSTPITSTFPCPFKSTEILPSASNSDWGTPYVGTVDLEWGLGPLNNLGYQTTDESDGRSSLPRHRSRSDPPGAYRIPPKGQLQVLIKNPSKTVVKIFLVPYDCRDMKPWTRTVLRQKSYIKDDLSLKAEVSTGASPLVEAEDDQRNGNLRYAVHLQFLCLPSQSKSEPSGGPGSTDATVDEQSSKRIYLYKSMRVVFSHRVPDGKEKLKVVTDVSNNSEFTVQDLHSRRRQRSSTFAGMPTTSTISVSHTIPSNE